jgi:hypothetical protein
VNVGSENHLELPMNSSVFSEFVSLYNAQPALWQAAIIFVAVVAGIFCWFAFAVVVAQLLVRDGDEDQDERPRLRPEDVEALLRNVEPVSEQSSRALQDALMGHNDRRRDTRIFHAEVFPRRVH